MVVDFFNIIVQGLHELSHLQQVLVWGSALLLAILCWWACVNYTRLWNKRFRTTLGHRLLCLVASVLTFLVVLTFVGLNQIKPVCAGLVANWADNLQQSKAWNDLVFQKAYNALKNSGKEDFSAVPAPWEENSYLPFSSNSSMALACRVYATEACQNFTISHRFLSRVLRTEPSVPMNVIQADMETFFAGGEDLYPMNRAVKLSAGQIKMQLKKQLPGMLRKTRFGLLVLFFLLQLIPLSIIGYCAYQDLKLNKYQLS